MLTDKARARRRRTVRADHNDPTTWLYRREVAKILNCSRDVVRYLEGNGNLHPIKDARGDWIFDPDEVDAYAKSHPRLGSKYYDKGDVTADAFKLFAAGKNRREVVIALRITCDRADRLWEQYQTASFHDAATRRQEAQAESEAKARAKERAERRRRALALMTAPLVPSTKR